MGQPHYSFESTVSNTLFSFISEGPRGRIEKRVQFTPIDAKTYNLGFGDWIEEKGEIDDMTVSDNGDMGVVLATVIEITRFFLSQNSTSRIFLTGSTPTRTRLYQIIISTNLDMLRADFVLMGFRNGRWSNFEKNLSYESFMVSKLF